MSKDIRTRIEKIVKDGEQMDYDRGGELVEIYQTSEVVENIVNLLEQEARVEAIEYQKWLTLFGWEISTSHPEKWYNGSELPYVYLSYEEVYEKYLQYKEERKNDIQLLKGNN